MLKYFLTLICWRINKYDEKANVNSWIPLIVVACASFIIVLGSLFMNVSFSRIVADLNSDVSTIQMIVSFNTGIRYFRRTG